MDVFTSLRKKKYYLNKVVRAISYSPRLLGRSPKEKAIAFEDLSEYPGDHCVPRLDRRALQRNDLSPHQKAWRENGYLILPNVIPTPLIDAYCRRREKWQEPGGWSCPTPYMHVPEIRDICLHPAVNEVMTELFGEPLMLHLNLTGWVSTERDWHQDDYLNPPFVNSHYLAAWIALDDISEDCGPFEFVPGSHRLPVLRQAKIRKTLAAYSPWKAAAEGLYGDRRHWASESEFFVTPAIEACIKTSGLEVKKFLGKKGDVLLWHGRLFHRGSKPRVSGTLRKALIGHYSVISKRPDMEHTARQDKGGGYYSHSNLPLY